MLTADQLDALTVPITDLYDEYMQTVLNDIARRLVKMGKPTATAAWQLQRLVESGKVYENAIKELAKLTGQSEKVLAETFQAAGVQAMRFDDSVYKAAGLNPLPLNQSPAMVQALRAGLEKTNGLINNLTLTTANTAQQSFIHAADIAYQQVITGTFSYDDAIKMAIKNVAGRGLQTINYASGHVDQLDVAMRRAVLTGVSQTSGVLQTTRADEMGQDLVQISAHIGARPDHQIWQGKIFSRSGRDRFYPPFVESTGYGTGAGLMGWNCRHSFYPYFKGISEPLYRETELQDYKKKTVTLDGQQVPIYEATQIQRGIERKIRYFKRQAGALKAGGLDNAKELGKVRDWQARMRDFIKQTGLQRQSVRERVILTGGKPPTIKPPKPTPPPKPAPKPAPAPKPVAPKPAAAPVAKWQPAKSVEEAAQRLERFIDDSSFKVWNKRKGEFELFHGINFSGIKLPDLNKILRGIEDVSERFGLKFSYIGNQIKTSRNLGYYWHYSREPLTKPRSLNFNKTYLKKAEETSARGLLASREKIAREIKYYEDAIADPLRKGLISHNEKKLETLKRIKYWTVDMAEGADPIEGLVRHEAYHGVYYQRELASKFAEALKRNGVTRDDWYAVSEYAGSSVTELFPELATAVDMGVDVPDNLRKALEETLEGLE